MERDGVDLRAMVQRDFLAADDLAVDDAIEVKGVFRRQQRAVQYVAVLGSDLSLRASEIVQDVVGGHSAGQAEHRLARKLERACDVDDENVVRSAAENEGSLEVAVDGDHIK